MDHMPPPIVYAPHADSPRSRSLIAAAVLCFAGTLVPLAWLAIQLANARTNEVLATFSGARLPFGLLLLENAASALALCGLLILAGVLLCHRARWAIHVTSALMGIVLVGATGATLAEAARALTAAGATVRGAAVVAATVLRGTRNVVVPPLSRRTVED